MVKTYSFRYPFTPLARFKEGRSVVKSKTYSSDCEQPGYSSPSTPGMFFLCDQVCSDYVEMCLTQCVILDAQVGRSNAGQAPIKSVSQIHPSLGHKDRLSYLRRDILANEGLIPAKASDGGGDKLLLDMFHWNQ